MEPLRSATNIDTIILQFDGTLEIRKTRVPEPAHYFFDTNSLGCLCNSSFDKDLKYS